MLLALKDVNTYYGQIHILQGVSLDVAEGELVCLLGGNASGKSTTLKTILGLVAPRSGSVVFEARTSRGRRPAGGSSAGWRSCRRTAGCSHR